MARVEPWQIFSENGRPLEGKSASREVFDTNKSLVMGASHVWVWRRNADEIELLLQKRAEDKMTWPGYLDISTAGHIDEGEDVVQAAIREAKEEIGIFLDENKLYYIFSLRTPLDPREFDTVYLYELTEEVDFTFDDGEVEELRWVSLGEFEEMTRQPEEHKLVPQGNEYFALTINALKRLRHDA